MSRYNQRVYEAYNSLAGVNSFNAASKNGKIDFTTINRYVRERLQHISPLYGDVGGVSFDLVQEDGDKRKYLCMILTYFAGREYRETFVPKGINVPRALDDFLEEREERLSDIASGSKMQVVKEEIKQVNANAQLDTGVKK